MLGFFKSRQSIEWERRLAAADPNDPEFQDRPVDLDDPEIPAAIRELARQRYEAGDQLWRIVCRTGIEWWLFSATGDLIEAWWME
ncbi:MAG: hypothetical protein FIA97_15065 [Methylococcaceae bacterium]|nr:hypothetical protein [Methylococcaceae bacterium]